MDPDLILVTGPRRSGTSATAGALAHCGGFVGRCQRMVEWTGLQWTPEAARFLRSDLWNRRASA